MREGWKSVQIEDIAKVVNGGTPKTKVADYWDGEHLWITPAEMGRLESPYLSNSRRKLSDSGLQQSSATLVPPHSVILSTRAPIGHLIINSVPMAFNQGCRGIVPSGNIHYKYLYYFLSFSVDLLNDLGSGTTFKELAAGKLKKVEIPLPSLLEQKRIVAILDEAFAGIATAVANTEKNLANARELFESFLNAVFTERGKGWIDFAISDVADVVSGYSFNSSDFKKGNPTHAIKIANVGVRKFVLESEQRLPAQFAKEFSRFQIPEGSIVIALTRSVIADGLKVAIVPKEFDGALLNQRVAALKIDNRCMRDYVFFFLCTRFVSDYVKKMANTLMQPNLSINDLRKLLVPVAPITGLRHIVQDIEALRSEVKNIESIYLQKLAALAELKQSLLQKAFSGELTAVKDASTATLREEEVA